MSTQFTVFRPGSTIAVELPGGHAHIRCDDLTAGRLHLAFATWDDEIRDFWCSQGDCFQIISGRTVILELTVTSIRAVGAVGLLECPISRGRIRGRMPRLRKSRVKLVRPANRVAS
jgi:hypothetical protein